MPPRYSILVVDDTSSVLTVTEGMLRRSGYNVTCANSGTEALQMLKQREFNLVLMDVVMEGMSGPEAARGIRLLHPNLPILFMTGFPEYLDNLDAQREMVIEKPFTAEKLTAAIAKVLNKTKAASSSPREET